jgi:hypothetical protein
VTCRTAGRVSEGIRTEVGGGASWQSRRATKQTVSARYRASCTSSCVSEGSTRRPNFGPRRTSSCGQRTSPHVGLRRREPAKRATDDAHPSLSASRRVRAHNVWPTGASPRPQAARLVGTRCVTRRPEPRPALGSRAPE